MRTNILLQYDYGARVWYITCISKNLRSVEMLNAVKKKLIKTQHNNNNHNKNNLNHSHMHCALYSVIVIPYDTLLLLGIGGYYSIQCSSS